MSDDTMKFAVVIAQPTFMARQLAGIVPLITLPVHDEPIPVMRKVGVRLKAAIDRKQLNVRIESPPAHAWLGREMTRARALGVL